MIVCLLLIDKARAKDKTYKSGTPKDRDEVNRRDVYECDG
jgi:hypothetical protein